MSTKAHIIYLTETEFYHETSQPQYAFDKFLGFDIGVSIGIIDIKEVTFEDGNLIIAIPEHSELKVIFGDKISFFVPNVFDLHFDAYGIDFFIKGGTYTSQQIETQKQR